MTPVSLESPVSADVRIQQDCSALLGSQSIATHVSYISTQAFRHSSRLVKLRGIPPNPWVSFTWVQHIVFGPAAIVRIVCKTYCGWFNFNNFCWASSVGSQRDATRICCWAPAPAARRPQQSIDISCPQGAHQHTVWPPLLLSIDGTDRLTDGRTDAQPLHRHGFVYYAGSVNIGLLNFVHNTWTELNYSLRTRVLNGRFPMIVFTVTKWLSTKFRYITANQVVTLMRVTIERVA